MGKSRPDLLQGTLDLLILRTLRDEPLHGWGISKAIRATSREVIRVHQGSLYPALYRLEERSLIRGRWGVSPEGRRAKFYGLTPRGRRRLDAEQETWRALSLAVNHVLGEA